MRGKIIVIEGTDCSGKETQTKLLEERLNKEGIPCVRFAFPNYDSPTGKIIGGPYLGKKHICDGWFNEGASFVDPKVASLYCAADRKYNINVINDLLNKGVNVILDRYVYSNMAYQGGKIKDKNKRYEMYEWLEKLEFDLLELPYSDIKILLYMPYDVSLLLKQKREEKLDQHEISKDHLLQAEIAYNEIAKIYNFYKVECNIGNLPKEIDSIFEEIYSYIKSNL